MDIVRRDEKRFVSIVIGSQDGWEESVDSFYRAIESELTKSERALHNITMLSDSFIDQEKKRYCKWHIKTSPDFADVGWCEIEDESTVGDLDINIAEGSADALFGFFDRGIREADDIDRG